MRTPRAASCALLLLLLAVPTASFAGVTFTDGQFNEGYWSDVSDLADCPYASVSTMRMGPTTQMGYWRYNGVFRISVGSCPQRLWLFTFRIRTTYEPAVTGAVRSVDFSALAVLFNAPYAGPGLGPALRQNGIVYVCDQLTLLSNIGWRTYSLECLSALDFHEPNGGGHPDFSANGAPFECGYFVCSSDPQFTSFRVELDDWVFAINPADCEVVPTHAPTWGEIKLRYR